MEIMVKVNVDFIDECGNLDSALKNQIINTISDRISEKQTKEINEIVAEKIDSVVDKKLNTIMKNFLKRKIKITDRWGDVEQYASVYEILKKRFDAFWGENVNDNGKTGGYGKSRKRIEWMVDERIKKQGEKYAKDIAKMVNTKIEDIMTDSLKVALGNNLVEKLGVPRIIKSIKKSNK